jgi:hypothetical protein
MVVFTRTRIQVISDATAQKLEDLIDAPGRAFAVITVAVFFFLRIMAIRFNWRTRSVNDPRA